MKIGRVFLFGACCVLSASCARWQRVDLVVGQSSVELPGAPFAWVQSSEELGGAQVHWLQATAKGLLGPQGTCKTGYVSLDERHAKLDRASEGLARMLRIGGEGAVRSQRTVVTAGYAGVEFVVDSGGFEQRARVVGRGERFYFLVVAGELAGSSEGERCLESLRFGPTGY